MRWKLPARTARRNPVCPAFSLSSYVSETGKGSATLTFASVGDGEGKGGIFVAR